MTKQLFLLWALVSTTVQSISQKPIPGSELSAYFAFVNQAARAIHKGNFEAASTSFQEAFRHKPIPFFCDLKNAIIVNSRLGYHEKNAELLKITLRDKHIDTVGLFQHLPPRLFDGNNLQLIRTYQTQSPVFNEMYRKAFFSLWQEEQDNLLSRLVPHQEIYTRFFDLFEKYGFPNEERIGSLDTGNNDVWGTLGTLFSNMIKQKGEIAQKTLQMLKIEFEKGNIPPSVLANCYDCASENSILDKKTFYFQNELLAQTGGKIYRPFIYYTDSVMQVINTNRIAIGLDSFHIAQKQYICGSYCHIPDCSDPNKKTIQTVPYISNPSFPYGFVKAAFEKEKQDMNWYLIDPVAVAGRCECEKKQY
ncbi:MAG: hypothetical protein LCH81_03920 [Bacteroidetes bacterium]|nr:hypothetical protein [Bacteroidota bacterium]